ncbi:hypothetical protein [Streptomyces sp. NPDC003660]
MTDMDGEANAPLEPLTVRSVIGGGLEDRRWTSVIDSLQASLREVEASFDVPFNLTVTYFVPGEVYGPKFSGIRIGSFLEDFRSLVVQVALPRHPERDARTEVLDLLDQAVVRAESWGKRKKLLSGALAGAREVASRLR